MPAAPDVTLKIRTLGRTGYVPCWTAMRHFTTTRTPHTPDEIWLTEHEPVYTLGLNGQLQHLLQPSGIPLIRSDRGGQITYHGPGQLILYPLLDIRRLGLGVRTLVHRLEASVIDLLAQFGIRATARPDAPGVYVEGAKIASLGIKVKKQGTYHGIALNVDGDLTPFGAINPCGYAGQPVTRLIDLLPEAPPADLAQRWVDALLAHLPAYRQVSWHDTPPTFWDAVAAE